MAEVWDEARVQQYIDDEVPEDVHLDYKSAGALGKQNDKRDGITKVVSALANSDGGHVIYGVHESNETPSHITPVDREKFSKNWLEQVIGNIRPNIEGVCVHQVDLVESASDSVYVVEVPKSDTLHQSSDKKYYKRFTSHSVPMEHFEILDVLNRQQHPKIELEFKLRLRIGSGGQRNPPYDLEIRMANTGNVYAQYIVAQIELPKKMMHDRSKHGMDDARRRISPDEIAVIRRDNTLQDIVSNPNTSERYGPKRYDPLLPTLKFATESITVSGFVNDGSLKRAFVKWTTYADSAPPRSGEVAIVDILIHDEIQDRCYHLRDLQ